MYFSFKEQIESKITSEYLAFIFLKMPKVMFVNTTRITQTNRVSAGGMTQHPCK